MKQCLNTILVVDDESNLRELVIEILEDMGYKAHGSCDGTEALEKLKEHNPFLVISDIKMPKMDGMQLLEEINKLSKPAPLVVLSTGFTTYKESSLIEKGAFKLLHKPFNLSDIEEIIGLAKKKYELE